MGYIAVPVSRPRTISHDSVELPDVYSDERVLRRLMSDLTDDDISDTSIDSDSDWSVVGPG